MRPTHPNQHKKIPDMCLKCKWLENRECHFEGENYGQDFVGDRSDTECFTKKK